VEDMLMHLIVFEDTAPMIQLKTMRSNYERFYADSNLKVSYSFERAILQALLPWDTGVDSETQNSSWLKLVIGFFNKMCDAYHSEFSHSTPWSTLKSQDLADPELQTTIQMKLFVAARMVKRTIVMIELDSAMRPGPIISQEPAASVKVAWPVLLLGRKQNTGEGTHPYVYHPGCICRLDLGNTVTRLNVLDTPSFLDANLTFAKMPDLKTPTKVTCNHDAVSVITTDLRVFGCTFAEKTSRPEGVCSSGPTIHLRRYLCTQSYRTQERSKVNIYTRRISKQGTSYSFFPDEKRGLLHQRKVALSKFPTYHWGYIRIMGLEFNIAVTILDFGKYQKQGYGDYKKLKRGHHCRQWTNEQLGAFVNIIKLTEKCYDTKKESTHMTVTKEYHHEWISGTPPPPRGGVESIIYNKMNGIAYSAFCSRIWETCHGIVAGKIIGDDKPTKVMAKKLIRVCCFSASAAGSKTSNWLANFYPINGVDGETQFMCNGYNVFKCLSSTLFTSVIPNPMSGVHISMDLGYNTVEETGQHSLLVLNEKAAELVKENLDRNVQIAKRWIPEQYQGNLQQLLCCLDFDNYEPDMQIEFWACICGMEVCVAPRGWAHGSIIEFNQNKTEVVVQFFESSDNVTDRHTFNFEDIFLAEVPISPEDMPCILFDLQTKKASTVFVSRTNTSGFEENVLMIKVPDSLQMEILRPNQIVCPVRQGSEPNQQHSYRDDNVSHLISLFDSQVHKTSSDMAGLCVNAPVKSQLRTPGSSNNVAQHDCHEDRGSPNKSGSVLKSNGTGMHFQSQSAPNPADGLKGSVHRRNGKGKLNLSQSAQNLADGEGPACKGKQVVHRSPRVPNFQTVPAVGLQNDGNLCYANAATQMLLSCNSLVTVISDHETTYSNKNSVSIFQEVINKMKKVAVNSIVCPETIDVCALMRHENYNVFYKRHNATDAQQDAQEFYISLYEKLCQLSPAVTQLSQFDIAVDMKCNQCCFSMCDTKHGLNFPFRVDVPPAGFACTGAVLETFFKSASREDDKNILDTSRTCPQCQTTGSYLGYKFRLTGKPPTFFVIQLDRTSSVHKRKMHSDSTICPEIYLDINGKGTSYSLRSMVCHHGDTIDSGHWYAYGNRDFQGVNR